jgi:hypothetical protein
VVLETVHEMTIYLRMDDEAIGPVYKMRVSDLGQVENVKTPSPLNRR